MDKRKKKLQKWKNGVGERIKEKLKISHDNATCVIEMVEYVSGMGEFGIQLTNRRRLVINLSNQTCT